MKLYFCDTGVEFPEMYEHIRKVEKYIERPITILKSKYTFEYLMFDYVKTKGKKTKAVKDICGQILELDGAQTY